MFDRHVHTTVESPKHVTVEVKRAPTDDAIRLADEMRSAAMKSLVAEYAMSLADNTFEGRVLVQRSLTTDYVCVAILKVNGKPLTFTWRLATWDVAMGPSNAAKKFKEACTQAIEILIRDMAVEALARSL